MDWKAPSFYTMVKEKWPFFWVCAIKHVCTINIIENISHKKNGYKNVVCEDTGSHENEVLSDMQSIAMSIQSSTCMIKWIFYQSLQAVVYPNGISIVFDQMSGLQNSLSQKNLQEWILDLFGKLSMQNWDGQPFYRLNLVSFLMWLNLTLLTYLPCDPYCSGQWLLRWQSQFSLLDNLAQVYV